MTDGQNKPVRSRDDQATHILDISEPLALNQEAPTTEFVLGQLEEAEARGAAEQRRKDWEQSRAKLFCQSEKDASDRTPERPDIVQWQKDRNEFFLSSLLEVVTEYAEWRDRKDADGQEPVAYTSQIDLDRVRKGKSGDIYSTQKWEGSDDPVFTIPLYTRPANVADLEARIAELEKENARLKTAQFYGYDEAEGGSDDISSFFDDHEPGTILEIDGYRRVNTKWVLWDGNYPHAFDTEDEATVALTRTGTPS